jgi:uncharacterized protein (DUF1697 family)
MARYAVLLRGINLGKVKRVGMADLRKLLTEEGYGNVATLLQSGNVVLDTEQSADKLGPAIEQAIEKRFGFPVAVILRSREELARVVATNPLREVATDGSKYVVAFMAEPPKSPVSDVLKGVDLGGDRHAVDGAEMYIWCPNGLRDSPLMTALGKAKDGPSATVRNWNTVEKLHAMMD